MTVEIEASPHWGRESSKTRFALCTPEPWDGFTTRL